MLGNKVEMIATSIQTPYISFPLYMDTWHHMSAICTNQPFVINNNSDITLTITLCIVSSAALPTHAGTKLYNQAGLVMDNICAMTIEL